MEKAEKNQNTIKKKSKFVRWLERWEVTAQPSAACTKRWERLPADLLEDVVSADVLDVLVDDGPGALLFGQLPLQPRHHLFVVVPQVGLREQERRRLVLSSCDACRRSQLRLHRSLGWEISGENDNKRKMNVSTLIVTDGGYVASW